MTSSLAAARARALWVRGRRVDFDLSDDQRALRDAARDLLAEHATTERVRASLGTGIDRDLWSALASQGWLAVEVDGSGGGLGLGFVEVALLAEAIGRHVAPAPFLSTVLARDAVARAAADGVAGATEWVERLATGDAIGAVGWSGELVVDAPIADVIVLADAEAVRLVTPATAPATEPAMDETRSVGWVRETGVAIGGPADAQRLFDRASAGYAAEMLGASERMLEVSVEYAKVREQFGRPIGSFQAIKHRLADALVDVEGMRSSAWYAGWSVSVEDPGRSLAASTAKAWCADASGRVMDSALQVHGGIGFTWEHDLHLYLKRAQLDQHVFGTAPAHRERLASLLEQRLAAGEDLW